MVDFTKSISNEHMTTGLKRLLTMSSELEDQCAHLEREESDEKVRDQLASLTQMHQSHQDLLSDSLLYLGAAPDQFKRANRRTHFPGAAGLKKMLGGSGVSGLRQQEAKLREACLEELEQLKASDEVVNTVDRIVEEMDAALESLDR